MSNIRGRCAVSWFEWQPRCSNAAHLQAESLNQLSTGSSSDRWEWFFASSVGAAPMKQAEKVQWSVKQTCFFGTSIVNVLIGKMRQRCRDSVYHVRSLLSSVCFPLCYELIFNHHIGRVFFGLSTDSAERRGSICGHVERRHHSGRWPILCCYLLHTQGSLTEKGLSKAMGWI